MLKMKVRTDRTRCCDECGCEWQDTEEMYSIAVANLVLVLCKNCVDTLFRKMLKESCVYDDKVKGAEDMKRIERARLRRENDASYNK